MPIDHKSNKTGTYKHRFWINEQDYKPGGPVFVFDCGEAAGQRYADRYLFNETNFFRQLTKKFHGIGIIFEHRYVLPTLFIHIAIPCMVLGVELTG